MFAIPTPGIELANEPEDVPDNISILRPASFDVLGFELEMTEITSKPWAKRLEADAMVQRYLTSELIMMGYEAIPGEQRRRRNREIKHIQVHWGEDASAFNALQKMMEDEE